MIEDPDGLSPPKHQDPMKGSEFKYPSFFYK